MAVGVRPALGGCCGSGSAGRQGGQPSGGSSRPYRDLDEVLGVGGAALVVATQPAAACQPTERLLYYPSAGQDLEAFHVVAALDDLQLHAQLVVGPVDQAGVHDVGVPAVDPDQPDAGILLV